ncbi:MAG: SpoIID/LytB domain-containing protein [Oscillospiraceae bacterium]
MRDKLLRGLAAGLAALMIAAAGSGVVQAAQEAGSASGASVAQPASAAPEANSGTDASGTEADASGDDSSASDASSDSSAAPDTSDTADSSVSQADSSAPEPDDSSESNGGASDSSAPVPDDSSAADSSTAQPDDSSAADSSAAQPDDSSTPAEPEPEATPQDDYTEGWMVDPASAGRYYQLADGSRKTGHFSQGGAWYCAAANGIIHTSAFVTVNGKSYYAKADGALATGLFQVGNSWYYAAADGAIQKSAFVAVNGKSYYAKADGALATGLFQVGNSWYYAAADGAIQKSAFVTVNGKSYYAKADGALATGVFQVGSQWYYGEVPSGAIRVNALVQLATAWYYAGADGAFLTGVLDVNGTRYVADAKGAFQKGYVTIEGKRYYASVAGAPYAVNRKKGWFTREDGVQCYAQKNGEIKGGWLTDGKKKYRLTANGEKQTGYFTVSKKRYYAKDSGVVTTKKGWVTRSDGVKVYAGEKGVFKSAWLESKGKHYRLDGYGVPQTGYFKVSGKLYYGSSKGVVKRTAGFVTRSDKVKIYVRDKGIIKKGWVESGGKRYYVNKDGVRQTGYFKVSGKLYYGSGKGEVKQTAGWVKRSDKVKIYVRNKGVVKKGWVEVGGKHYYVDKDGVRQTGYFKVSGKTYYGSSKGVVRRTAGWVKRGDKVKIYVRSKGVVKAGLVTVGSVKYYLNAEGVYQTGFFTAGGRQYYAPSSGKIKSGWKTVGGQRYYVGKKGYLLTGRQKIKGVYYQFDSAGRLEQGDLLTVKRGGKTVTDTAVNILARVVMAEVGGFQNKETYKAQAIAASTFIRYHLAQGTVPTVPEPSQEPIALVWEAVGEVAHMYLTYKGEAALTTYYAASNGKTNNSGDFWPTQLPYLVSVDSAYENAKTVTGFKTTKSISTADFRKMMDRVYDGNYTLGADPATWVQTPTRNAAGYVTGNVLVGGRTPSVEYFYQNMAGLRSPDFTVKYDKSADALVFTVKGYGHGVGMSQWGAYLYAKNGWNYKKILAHYYPGTTLVG